MRLCCVCFVLILLTSAFAVEPAEPVAGPLTVVVVRHAEKADDGGADPELSVAGRARARALVQVLERTLVDAVYATQYKRTRQTVEPLARHFGLETRVVPVTSGDIETYAQDLSRQLQREHAGQTVVIAGHSNTVPTIVEGFAGDEIETMSEDDYDRLYTIIISPAAPPRLIRSRYGPSHQDD